jgi:patatin-like phospholipase/acyl hydrolase
MASKEHKIVRRAQAMSELARLSGLLAERLNVEVPNINTTNRDTELAEIQRIENINRLLTQVLSGSEGEEKPVKKSVKHGARQ